MSKIAEHIKSEYIAKTTSTSTNGIFPFTGKPLTAIILLAIYLVSDVSQYFITALLYGIGFYIRNKSYIESILM